METDMCQSMVVEKENTYLYVIEWEAHVASLIDISVNLL